MPIRETIKRSFHKRGQPVVLLVSTLVALLVASAPMSAPALAAWQHNQQINNPEYKMKNGYWDVVDLPQEFRLNTIHAAVLPTGKVLLVAGSGNNRDNFNAFHEEGAISVLKTAVFDPDTNSVKIVPTPSDLFCSGHALLQSGNLLVAGGTSGYELLDGEVKKPAGSIVIHVEDPDMEPRVLKKGTKFISPAGKAYVTTNDVKIYPAEKMDHGDGNVMVMHSSANVFIEAVEADPSYLVTENVQFKIEGLEGKDAENIYGQGGPLTLNKQDYRGDNRAYEFDPIKEQYVRVGDMHAARWYPSLPVLTNGQVVAVSGLDTGGQVTDINEFYNPATKDWKLGPTRFFPTYPALFRTNDPDVLFFSGSNAGYGPADKGRQPGFWNVKTNSFKPVSGLRQTNILETSGSVHLPPAKGTNDGSQNYKIMVAGGGGVGESSLVTGRTDIIDLADPDPHFVPGPDLVQPVRYINLVVMPWDEIIASGGSQDYRGKGNSYSNKTFSINPANNEITQLADEEVPRSYHSGSLLLRDGRLLVFGNDPLFSDKDNTAPGKFEQRLEIYTPPQLFTGEKPTLIGADNQEVHRGQQLTFASNDAAAIKTARLIPPSSTTHVTNVEQRSVGVAVKNAGGRLDLTLPDDENLLPDGWYMLFVVTGKGTPARALMVHVVS